MLRRLAAPSVSALFALFFARSHLARSSLSRAPPLTLTDVTAAAGIRFVHNSGATGKKYLPETMGSGVAFLDADGDGWQDLFFVNSKSWPGAAREAVDLPALYRNTGKGSFVDVTRDVRSRRRALRPRRRRRRLRQRRRRRPVRHRARRQSPVPQRRARASSPTSPRAAGVGASDFSTSAAWVDYDKDGWLDLIVLNYVQWSIADRSRPARSTARTSRTARPRPTRARARVSFTAGATARFEDVTKSGGVCSTRRRRRSASRSSTTTATAGWICSSPTTRSRTSSIATPARAPSWTRASPPAWRSTTRARRAPAWAPTPPTTTARAAPASSSATSRTSGSRSITTRAAACSSTMRRRRRLRRRRSSSLSFACFFFDVDLDGLPDIFAGNGHVADDIQQVQPKIAYAQAPHLFRNLGNRKFEVLDKRVGAAFQTPVVARGAAYRRLRWRRRSRPRDHRRNNGPARLFRNDGGNRNAWLRVVAARREVEPQRHRREGDGHAGRRPQGVGHGEDRLELPVAERAAADARPRPRRPRARRSKSSGRAARSTRSVALERQPRGHDRRRQGRAVTGRSPQPNPCMLAGVRRSA